MVRVSAASCEGDEQGGYIHIQHAQNLRQVSPLADTLTEPYTQGISDQLPAAGHVESVMDWAAVAYRMQAEDQQ